MDLHLNYNPAPLPFKISHSDRILLMGSCFSENIGNYLQSYKFNCLSNPNGILFNPTSIATALYSYTNERNAKDQLIKSGNLFYSLDHHGDFHSESETELRVQIKSARAKAVANLRSVNYLIVTFGSAFVYRYLKSNLIVANCHKLPPSEFKKELLSCDDIVNTYTELIKAIKSLNPGIKFIFTVSPVKYLKDGVIENSLSKSILINSVHQIITQNNDCSYFPAYEIMNDDLRDYRFYKEDLCHPNDLAIKYIWEKFIKTLISEDSFKLVDKIGSILKAVAHRPITIDHTAISSFKKKMLEQCKDLEKEFPFLDLEEEKKNFIA